jgi:SOS-response transcriptional repressor LexA
MTALMPRQADCLKVIKTSIEWRGYSPSYREIELALGLHSRSGVHRLVKGLEDRGAISRIPHRSRGLTIVEHGSDVLAFLPRKVRSAVQSFAQEQGIPAQAAVAEICRRYFQGAAKNV